MQCSIHTVYKKAQKKNKTKQQQYQLCQINPFYKKINEQMQEAVGEISIF